MTTLTNALKEEHGMLMNVFNEIKAVGFESQDGMDKMMAAKSMLLAHMKKEDTELYPVLRRAEISDEHLKITLNVFTGEMADIAKLALEFFDKYSAGYSGKNFNLDLERLVALISHRISREEDILFRAYDNIKS